MSATPTTGPGAGSCPISCNVTLISDALGQSYRLRISANALRTVEHRGGLDAFLAKAEGRRAVAARPSAKRQIAKKLGRTGRRLTSARAALSSRSSSDRRLPACFVRLKLVASPRIKKCDRSTSLLPFILAMVVVVAASNFLVQFPFDGTVGRSTGRDPDLGRLHLSRSPSSSPTSPTAALAPHRARKVVLAASVAIACRRSRLSPVLSFGAMPRDRDRVGHRPSWSPSCSTSRSSTGCAGRLVARAADLDGRRFGPRHGDLLLARLCGGISRRRPRTTLSAVRTARCRCRCRWHRDEVPLLGVLGRRRLSASSWSIGLVDAGALRR